MNRARNELETGEPTRVEFAVAHGIGVGMETDIVESLLLGCGIADSFTSTRQWLYNRRSELVGATGTQAHPYDYAYSYDSIGNRLTASDDSGIATYVANSLNQYIAVNRTIDQSVQSNNFTYDADGNLTQDDRFNYAYDDENRLVLVTPRNPSVGSLAIENAYDHRNRRIRKVVKSYDGSSWNVTETSLFVWDGWNIVMEQITFADNTTRTVEYFWGNDFSGAEEDAGGVGGLLATRIDGVFYVPVYGANGNVMMYVDAMGAIAAQFDYDPYGCALVAPNYWENLWNFAFSTKYHDWETDLVAYQLRTYDPVHGRWLNRDPIEERGGENLYGFVYNLPSISVDGFGTARFLTGSLVREEDLKFAPKDFDNHHLLYGGYDYALKTIGLIRELNSHPCIDANIYDLTNKDALELLKKEIETNRDNVFVIAHGGLKVNGEIFDKIKIFQRVQRICSI